MNAPLKPLRAVTAAPPSLELLLVTHPLSRILHGQRKETFMRAWTRAAIAEARVALSRQDAELPENPRAVLLELHACVLELAEALGVGRIEFADHFNQRGESGARGTPETIGDATMRAMALLALFCARRMESAL